MSELPVSPYLTRLEAAARATRNPVESACLRIERAGFLARQGFFDEAVSEIDLIRAQFGSSPHAEVTVWLCIAESWVAHFSSLGTAAYDKMHRALALSSAMGLTRLQGLSAAWLAHFDYARYDIVSMAKHLTEAIRVAKPEDHGSQARIGMVAAIAYHFAKREDLATPWYAHARAHASAHQDSATLGAVTYNMTVIRSTHAFQAAIFGGDSTTLAKSALVGADASQGVVDLFGNVAQDTFIPIVKATILSTIGEYRAAIALYEKNLDAAERHGFNYLRATHLANLAWCRLNAGDTLGARRDALSAAAHITPLMRIDDRAATHGRLYQVFSLLGDSGNAAMHADAADRDWNAVLKLYDQVLLVMEGVFPSTGGVKHLDP